MVDWATRDRAVAKDLAREYGSKKIAKRSIRDDEYIPLAVHEYLTAKHQ